MGGSHKIGYNNDYDDDDKDWMDDMEEGKRVLIISYMCKSSKTNLQYKRGAGLYFSMPNKFSFLRFYKYVNVLGLYHQQF